MELTEITLSRHLPECREKFFEDLYEKAFPPFARYVAKFNASFQDAKDVFHDALVIYYEKSQDAGFAVSTSSEAYVFGIARNLWLKKFNRERAYVSLDGSGKPYDIPEDHAPDAQEVKLLGFLERSGRKCMDLLQKFYFEKSTLKEIALLLGYKTEHSVAVQKFKCIGKIREVIKARSLRYEDFRF